MQSTSTDTPLVVGIGGTTRPDSSSERALRAVLSAIEERGVETRLLGAAAIDLPMYNPDVPERHTAAGELTEAIRTADAVVVASPGYHGGYSGLVKNALDYIEDLRTATPPYLEGRAVGLVVCAYGWQATTTTLTALRSVVHALRGWPTPLGVAINSSEPVFAADGSIVDERISAQLQLLADQVGRAAVRHREALRRAA
jgi:FMN reductase